VTQSDGDTEADDIKGEKLKAKELLRRAQEAKAEIDEIKRVALEELQVAEQTRREAEQTSKEADRKVCGPRMNFFLVFWALG